MSEEIVKVGIIGATGYVGFELLKILLKHPFVKVVYLAAKIEKEINIQELFPSLKERASLTCYPFKGPEDVPSEVECIFLALPHGVSMQLFPSIMNGRRVIDLSADFRLPKNIYEAFYKREHIIPELIEDAVYGLAELFFDKIKDAHLVAVPGCYPTAALLALAPVFTEEVVLPSVFIDAKSGISGAGREPSLSTHFPEANENILPYNVIMHRHVPEIEEYLNKISKKRVNVTFVPHLAPLTRGLIMSCFALLAKEMDYSRLLSIYKEYYKGAKFLRFQEQCCIKDVVNSNFCDISIYMHNEGRSIVIIAALDNLLKGAAGQAVQCMNIMYGWDEGTGLL